MDPLFFLGFGVMGLAASTLLVNGWLLRRKRIRDEKRILEALGSGEHSTLHLSNVTDIPIHRVHLAADRLESAGKLSSRHIPGGPERNYHSKRMVSSPKAGTQQNAQNAYRDSGGSSVYVYQSPSSVFLENTVVVPDPAPSEFSGFHGGSSGGGGATDSWSSSYSSSSSSDSGSSGDGGDGGGGDGGGDGG